ncbi:MAG: hypothetical protein NVSMB9_13160 [Isosphaeraceae bacterium]
MIKHALDAKHIRSRVDDKKRVQVAAERLDEADEIVAKLDVGPRPLSEIDDWARASNPWDAFGAREQRQEQAENKRLGAMISRMDGLISADVTIKRVKSRGPGRPTSTASALIYLETEENRKIAEGTVEKIQALILAAVPEIRAVDVNIFDTKGNHYLDVRSPSLSAQAKNRARREELRQEILKELDGLKGVQVSVRLVPASAPLPLPPVPSPASAPRGDEVRLPPLAMGLNQPVEQNEEPVFGSSPDDLKPALDPGPVAAAPAPPPSAGAEPTVPLKAKVWVKVPRSFYLKASPNREPSLDELQQIARKTEGLIDTAVRQVVHPGELDEVVVSTFPDELPDRDTPVPPGAGDGHRALSWWVPVGAAAGASASLVSIAFGVLAARRPALRPAARPRDDRGRYKIDAASDAGPGPSERVRELIRLNPEAAASVLRRWTGGQGGSIE